MTIMAKCSNETPHGAHDWRGKTWLEMNGEGDDGWSEIRDWYCPGVSRPQQIERERGMGNGNGPRS